MFERNLLVNRFLSIPLVVLSPARKNFRVSEMLSVENLEDESVGSCPFWYPASELWFRRKTRFSI